MITEKFHIDILVLPTGTTGNVTSTMLDVINAIVNVHFVVNAVVSRIALVQSILFA